MASESLVSKPGLPLGMQKHFVQPKLEINTPGDRYEQEADAMAERVMQFPPMLGITKPITGLIGKSVQQKCKHCEEGEKKELQRKEANNNATVADTSTENYISSLSGKGKSLTQSEKSFFEPKFGYDFSNVQLHTNSEANQSAQSTNALAYKHGNNIVSGANQYQPNTDAGKKLLAHEVAHTIQKNGTGGSVQQLSIDYHEVLRSVGQPLDPAARAFMEPCFGHDFGSVRVHTDTRAAKSAHAVSAHAYTVGQNIVFGENKYAPTSRAGRELLAHELAHVVQQSHGGTRPPLNPYAQHEQAASAAAERVVGGQRAEIVSGTGVGMARALESEVKAEQAAGAAATARRRLAKAITELNELQEHIDFTKANNGSVSSGETTRAYDAVTLATTAAQKSGDALLILIAESLQSRYNQVINGTAALPIQVSAMDPRHARGYAGEQGMGFVHYSQEEGWILIEGPSGASGHGVTTTGFDGVAYNPKLDELDLCDNKSLNTGTVRSATAISRNLVQNLDVLIARLTAAQDVAYRIRVLELLRQARAAAAAGRPLPGEVKLMVTGVGGRSTGVSRGLALQGVVFRSEAPETRFRIAEFEAPETRFRIAEFPVATTNDPAMNGRVATDERVRIYPDELDVISDDELETIVQPPLRARVAEAATGSGKAFESTPNSTATLPTTGDEGEDISANLESALRLMGSKTGGHIGTLPPQRPGTLAQANVDLDEGATGTEASPSATLPTARVVDTPAEFAVLETATSEAAVSGGSAKLTTATLRIPSTTAPEVAVSETSLSVGVASTARAIGLAALDIAVSTVISAAIILAITLIINWLAELVEQALIKRDINALEPEIRSRLQELVLKISELQKRGKVYATITFDIEHYTFAPGTGSSGGGDAYIGTFLKDVNVTGQDLGNTQGTLEKPAYPHTGNYPVVLLNHHLQTVTVLLDDPQKRAREQQTKRLLEQIRKSASKTPQSQPTQPTQPIQPLSLLPPPEQPSFDPLRGQFGPSIFYNDPEPREVVAKAKTLALALVHREESLSTDANIDTFKRDAVEFLRQITVLKNIYLDKEGSRSDEGAKGMREVLESDQYGGRLKIWLRAEGVTDESWSGRI